LSEPKVSAAIIIAPRKAYSQLVAPEGLELVPGLQSIYVNMETKDTSIFSPMIDYMRDSQQNYDLDAWSVNETTWFPDPIKDQDHERLGHIIIARNMALNYAMTKGLDYMLFVDSDVQIQPDGLRKLLAIGKPLTGGLVRGRGDHSHVTYTFGPRERIGRNIYSYNHGTCGYMLVHKSIFEQIRFRWGPHPNNPKNILSEDPAFQADAEARNLCDGWYIDHTATAYHIDNPDAPLRMKEAVNDYVSE
jgi:hypothetical protein